MESNMNISDVVSNYRFIPNKSELYKLLEQHKFAFINIRGVYLSTNILQIVLCVLSFLFAAGTLSSHANGNEYGDNVLYLALSLGALALITFFFDRSYYEEKLLAKLCDRLPSLSSDQLIRLNERKDQFMVDDLDQRELNNIKMIADQHEGFKAKVQEIYKLRNNSLYRLDYLLLQGEQLSIEVSRTMEQKYDNTVRNTILNDIMKN